MKSLPFLLFRSSSYTLYYLFLVFFFVNGPLIRLLYYIKFPSGFLVMGRPFFGILFIHIDPTDGQFVQVIIELLTGIDKNASSIYQRENDGFNKFFIGLYGTEVDVVTQYFFFFVRFFGCFLHKGCCYSVYCCGCNSCTHRSIEISPRNQCLISAKEFRTFLMLLLRFYG